MATVGYSNPLVFKRNLRPGIIHPLDGIDIEYVRNMTASLSQTRMVELYDDFVLYPGPTSEGNSGGYSLTGTVGTASVSAAISSNSGEIQVNTGATEDDNFVFAIQNYRPRFALDKLIIYHTRVSLSDVDDMEFYAGWGTFAADWVAALPTQGLFFAKSETQTSLDFHVRSGGVSTTQTFSTVTLENNTQFELSIRCENGNVTPYVYAGGKWHIGTTVDNTDPNLPTVGGNMFLQWAAETGAAAANSVVIDNYFYGREQ